MEEYNLRKNGRRRNNRNNKERYGDNNKKENIKNGDLISVYDDTVEYFNEHQSKIGESILYNIDWLLMQKIPDTEKDQKCIIEVEDEDTLDMGERYCKEYKTCVLNLASAYKPGGGVKSGKTAQEECIFRRSNAHLTHIADWYPLKEDQILFSPLVTVIKNSDYEPIEPFTVGMIAAAAIRKPNLDKGNYYDEDRELMTRKIESIFVAAILQGYEALVLGALGCGVYNNPPQEVSHIFKIMLLRYKKFFKKIGFAVLCKRPKDKENLKEFRKLL